MRAVVAARSTGAGAGLADTPGANLWRRAGCGGAGVPSAVALAYRVATGGPGASAGLAGARRAALAGLVVARRGGRGALARQYRPGAPAPGVAGPGSRGAGPGGAWTLPGGRGRRCLAAVSRAVGAASAMVARTIAGAPRKPA